MRFIGSSVPDDGTLLFLAPAGSRLCAGEGELVAGLTKHDAMIATPEGSVKRQLVPLVALVVGRTQFALAGC